MPIKAAYGRLPWEVPVLPFGTRKPLTALAQGNLPKVLKDALADATETRSKARSLDRLLVGVPNILRQFPASADLFPHDGIFDREVLRCRAFALECTRADLTSRPGAERLDVDGRAVQITM
jgi:hypothetical protein